MHGHENNYTFPGYYFGRGGAYMNNRRFYKILTAVLLAAGLVFAAGSGSVLASDGVSAEDREGTAGDVSYSNEDNVSDSAYDASSPEGSSDSSGSSGGNSGSSDSSSGDKTQNSSGNSDQSSAGSQSQGSSDNASSGSGSGSSQKSESGQNAQSSQNSQNDQGSQNSQSSGNTQTSSGTQKQSSGQSASATQSAASSVPKIYAATGVSATYNIKPAENANVLTVGNYLMTDLSAAIVASDGTNLTNEVWQHAFVPQIAWMPMPAGYDAANPGPYSFLWTGTVPKGSIIYSDAKMSKAAAVAADIPVVVTFNVTDKATGGAKGSVSSNDATGVPRTGDDFAPGLWVYFLIIGLVVCLCSFILYADTSKR